MAVRLTVSLHGFQIGIFYIGDTSVLVYFHAQRLRLYIFVLRIQVVYALAELGRLLRVEHIEDCRVRHPFPYTLVCRFQFVRKLLAQVLPQYTVMTCIGIYSLFIRTKFGVRGIFVHVPIVLQTSVITYTKDCIAIVKYHVGKRLVLVRVIPKRHHHVLHTLVNTSHNVRKHIVVTKVIHIKIVGQFGFEFRSIVLSGLYPRYNSLQIGWNFRAGLILGIDVVIVRKACLKHFHPIRCAVIPLRREVVVKEHAHRIVVIQEFPAFRRVLSAELLRHPFLVVVARYVQEAEHGLRALVVVEVELPKELRRLVNAATVKQIARLAVYRCTHIILVTVVTVLLRRCQLSCCRQHVLHNFRHTGVVRAGTFREVGLQAEAVHRRGLFLAAIGRTE